MTTKLMVPTVHLNGTSKRDLEEQLNDAYQALTAAEKALCQAAPNGRDYYTQGPDAFYKAQDEHIARLTRLGQVKQELQQIAEEIAFK